MKILLVTDGIEGAHLSEAGLWLSELSARLVARGHRVHVVSVQPLEAWQRPEDPPGVKVWRPGIDAFDSAIGEALELRPDVLHVATVTPLGSRVIESLCDWPLLLDLHDFASICPNRDLLRRPRYEACAQHFPYSGCGACAGLLRLRAMDDRTMLARGADRIIAHSTFARDRNARALGRDDVELVTYGVDTLRFRPSPQPPLAPEIAALYAERRTPRVLFLGPPTYGRGASRLIDLLTALHARLPEAELIVAGQDPQDPDWDSMFRGETKELGLAHLVRVLPEVAASDLPALYASCDVACAPLVAAEPGGLFTLQALATGLPVVATPVGAMRDLIRSGASGCLVPGWDVSRFANAITGLIVDPGARAEMSSNARLEAMERHDIEATLVRMEELYRRAREHRAAAREGGAAPEGTSSAPAAPAPPATTPNPRAAA